MTPIEIRNSVLTLQRQGTGLREIAKLLGLSRNTVRRILREPVVRAARVGVVDEAMQRRLAQVYARAGGNAVRMGQILASDYEMELPYSTLTRWVRQAELRAAPKRSGEYHFAPGQEMQHDTSPHRIEVAGKPLKAQCAGLTLAYSRRLCIQYYPSFTRFEAKHFLLHAAQFMDGTAPRCVIDNTSVVLAGGAGANAGNRARDGRLRAQSGLRVPRPPHQRSQQKGLCCIVHLIGWVCRSLPVRLLPRLAFFPGVDV